MIRRFQVFLEIFEGGQWIKHCFFEDEGDKIPYKKYRNVKRYFAYEHEYRKL